MFVIAASGFAPEAVIQHGVKECPSRGVFETFAAVIIVTVAGNLSHDRRPVLLAP